jgi:hypothetical protein
MVCLLWSADLRQNATIRNGLPAVAARGAKRQIHSLALYGGCGQDRQDDLGNDLPFLRKVDLADKHQKLPLTSRIARQVQNSGETSVAAALTASN